MTSPPDWVLNVPSTPGIHTEPPLAYQWQGPTWVDLFTLAGQLLESFIAAVVKAITGLFAPGGLGAAVEQLEQWAATIPIIGDFVSAIIGQVGDLLDLQSWFTDLLAIFGLSPNSSGLGSGNPILEIFDNIPFFGPLLDAAVQMSSSDVIEELVSGQWFVDLLALLGNPLGLGDGNLEDILASLGDIPIIGTALTAVQDLIDTIWQAITGLGDTGNLLEDVLSVLQNIPGLNILGLGGPANIISTVQSTWDTLIGGFVGEVVSGLGLADIFNISQTVSIRASLGNVAWDHLNVYANRPIWSSPIISGFGNFALAQVSSGPDVPTFAVTNSTAITGYRVIEKSDTIGFVSWLGSGTVDNFEILFYIMNPNTGYRTEMTDYWSDNIVAQVSTDLEWNIYNLPTPLPVSTGDILGVEFAVGSGTYNIVGQDTWVPPHPIAYPKRMASVRNSASAPPPISTLIDTFDTEEATWTGWDHVMGATGTIYATNGELQITPANGSDTMQLVSTGYYNMQGAEMIWWVKTPQFATGYNQSFGFISAADTTDKEWINLGGDQVWQWQETINNSNSTTTLAYNATNHAWIKIKVDGTTITWETAPNSNGQPGTWTVRRTKTIGAINLSRVQFFVNAVNPDQAVHVFDSFSGGGVDYSTVNVPWIETGVTAGETQVYHAPQTWEVTGDDTITIPPWCGYIDVIGVGGGGSGATSTLYGGTGKGGSAGNWNTATWIRGEDFDDTTTEVTVDIGSAGQAVVISVPGHTVTCTAGTYGGNTPTASGESAGVYTVNEIQYQGGYGGLAATSNYNPGKPGNPPGGGGGGAQSYNTSPGLGSIGRAWIVFRQ